MWELDMSELRMVSVDGGEDVDHLPDGTGTFAANSRVFTVCASPDPDLEVSAYVVTRPPTEGNLWLGLSGRLEGADEVVRICNAWCTPVWTGRPASPDPHYAVWVDDLDEPQEIWIQLDVTNGELDDDAIL